MTRDQGPVVITGVTGFIGSNVARYFSEKGWAVVGIDKTQANDDVVASLSSYHRLTLPDPAFDVLLKNIPPQLCIHCAGSASVGQSIIDVTDDFYANTVLTFEVLNALSTHAPHCRFVFLSSAAVYGNPSSLPITENHAPAPLSPYGFHKWQCEQLCREFTQVYSLPTACVRIFSAYGPGLRRQVLWDICEKAMKQKSIMLQGTGQESRDFVHVSDIAQALLAVALSAPMNGEIYNIGSGRETRINELANIVVEELGSQCLVEFDGVVPQGTPLNWRADMSKLSSLGFKTSLPLERGVREFVQWFLKERAST